MQGRAEGSSTVLRADYKLLISSNGHKRDRIRGCVLAGRCWPMACFAVADAERANNKNERGKKADSARGLKTERSVDNERKDRSMQRDLMSEGRKKRGGWKMLSPCCETGEAQMKPSREGKACPPN